MAPKKKGSKNKGSKKGRKEKGVKGGKKLPKVSECLHPSEMSKGQLMGHMKRLMAEKDAELVERNLFMLEKKKLWAIWQLLMEKMAILKDQALSMDIKIQKSLTDKGKENSIQSQKLRMLQSEEIKNFGFVRLNHLMYTKNISDDIWAIENILRESSLSKRKSVRKALASFYEIIRGLRLVHAESVSDMLVSLSRSILDFETLQDRKFFERKTTWEEQFTPQMDVLKHRKYETLDFMMLAHERGLLEMKTFFDDVATNNLAVMSMLAEEIDGQKLKENRLRRDLRLAKEKYNNIHDHLERMMEDVKMWESRHTSMKNMLKELKKEEQVLKQKENCAHMMDVSNECIRQQISIALVERNKAKVEFGRAVTKMQRQAQMQSLIYQLKTKAAAKECTLFQAVTKDITKSSTDPINYVKQLKQSKVEQIRNISTNLQTFEDYATDAKELECIEQQNAVDLESVGLQNKISAIQQPWRKLQPDHTRPCCFPRYKEILRPNNIFNQLPQLVLKPSSSAITHRQQVQTSKSSASNLSRTSTALISIFPPKTLSHITSRRLNNVSDSTSKFNTVHQTVTQEKLRKVLRNVEWKIQNHFHEPHQPPSPPTCDINFNHHSIPNKFSAVRGQKCSLHHTNPHFILKHQPKCAKSKYY